MPSRTGKSSVMAHGRPVPRLNRKKVCPTIRCRHVNAGGLSQNYIFHFHARHSSGFRLERPLSTRFQRRRQTRLGSGTPHPGNEINFTALLDGGEDVDAVVSGKLWHDAATDAELPAVGDWVAIDPGEAGDEAVIRAILPRQTCFPAKLREKQRGTGSGNQCGHRSRGDGAGNGLQPQAHGALLYAHPPQRRRTSHPAQ